MSSETYLTNCDVVMQGQFVPRVVLKNEKIRTKAWRGCVFVKKKPFYSFLLLLHSLVEFIKDKIVFLARYVHELRCLKQRQRQDFLSLTLCAWTQVSRTKGRRLLLLNDRVVCVTVTGRPSEGTPRRIIRYF